MRRGFKAGVTLEALKGERTMRDRNHSPRHYVNKTYSVAHRYKDRYKAARKRREKLCKINAEGRCFRSPVVRTTFSVKAKRFQMFRS